MSAGPELPADAGGARDSGEDTLELQLTTGEQLALSQAADAVAHPVAKVAAAGGHDTFVYRRTARVDFVCTLTFVGLVLVITAASGWHALVGKSTAPLVAFTVPAAPPAQAPVADEPPQAPLVQVVNPFDATEVFEFAPGTTESKAREAIAEMLLERGRERLRQGLNPRRASNRRHANPIPANPPDVFVTRLSSADPPRISAVPGGVLAVAGLEHKLQ